MVVRFYVAVLAVSVTALSISCTPSSLTAPDVTATSTEGGKSPCQIDLEICQARLIRTPNGSALCPPCDAGYTGP